MYKNDYVQELVKFYKKSVENLTDLSFSKNVSGISHKVIIPKASYSPWLDDQLFLSCYEEAKEHTLVDIYRCYELFSFITRHRHLKGDILEVGVWKGGSGLILAKALQTVDATANIFLADTFEGVVKAGENDTIYKGGEHADTSEQTVRQLLQVNTEKNITILKGIFPDQIDLPENCEMLRLCHIDVDTYDSAKDIFERVWPLITPGGAVFFDDYGFWGCEGITKLCNELNPSAYTFIHNLNGHAIFIKL